MGNYLFWMSAADMAEKTGKKFILKIEEFLLYDRNKRNR